MNRTPVADWQQLSALYELAVALDAESLDDWLLQLQAQTHPLLGQLREMLQARAQVDGVGFLGTLPKIRLAPETLPSAVEWKAGSLLGVYRLLRRLGSGGMAEVWLAQRDDGVFERQVAIKLLFRNERSSERDSFAQRFERERHILASLDHPNIAGLHDAGVTREGQPWLALEYVEGQTLGDWCDARHLGVRERVQLFRQVLLAVQHAHANLVIHRDLKPGNILVTALGEVRLLDFGIAKLLEPEGGASAETELTRLAGRPMTPQYAAPEQLLGQPLTTGCDVYSLGVVLYELLCGDLPYELKVSTPAQLEQAVLEAEPRAPSRRGLEEPTAMLRGASGAALRKLLAPDLDAIVLRALAKQPARRYASVEALRADLDRWLGGEPVMARAPSALDRAAKFVRRHVLAVSLGSAAVAALAIVAAVAVFMGLQAREDSARAVAARDFMLNIFARADQEKSRGADITARDLMETGRQDVLTRLAGQPKLQAELLSGIAKIQSDMGEYVTADRTYGELAKLYQALHRPRDAAFALADHAYNAILLSNPALAARRLDQAKAVQGRPVDDAELNACMEGVEGWIAINQGEPAAAREFLLKGRQRAIATLGESHLQTFKLGLALFKAERDLQALEPALAMHRALRRVSNQVIGLSPTEPAGLDVYLVELLYKAGRFAQALAAAEAAVAECDAQHGANNQYCRLLQIKKWQTLQRLGFEQRALVDEPRIAALAKDAAAPVTQVNAMLLQLRLRSGTGHSEVLEDLRERVRAFGESGSEVAVRPMFKVAALLTLAETALHEGEPIHAQRWLDAAASRLGSMGPPRRAEMFDAVQQALQGVALLQRGLPAQGLDALNASQALFQQTLGAQHPLARLYALNGAVALAQLGRVSEAQSVVDANDAALRDAFGEDAPAYAKVTRFKLRLASLALAPRAQAALAGSLPLRAEPLVELEFFS